MSTGDCLTSCLTEHAPDGVAELTTTLNPVTIAAVHTVLVVEDDFDLRHMLRTALAFAGYRVLQASDGLAALQMIDCNPPDLVLLDLGLPIVTGAVVRQEIAAQAHTPNIPIVVITGEPGDHTALDVACVLRKPLDPDRVIAAVRRCMAESKGTTIVLLSRLAESPGSWPKRLLDC